MSLRDVKARARGDLHQAMRVPMVYLAPDGAEYRGYYCRVHSDNKALGDLQGTSLNYAERKEVVPRLVFWLADMPPVGARGRVVISTTEGYRLDNADPKDQSLTVTWTVTPIPERELLNLPVP